MTLIRARRVQQHQPKPQAKKAAAYTEEQVQAIFRRYRKIRSGDVEVQAQVAVKEIDFEIKSLIKAGFRWEGSGACLRLVRRDLQGKILAEVKF